jgi:hypothetical protein
MHPNLSSTEAPPQQIAGGRPCSICGQYLVGAENAWLCCRCGFDGPHAGDIETEPESSA